MSVAQPPAFRTLLFVWNEKYAGGGFFFLFLLGPLDVFPSCRPRLSITCRFAPQWVYERRSSRWGFYLGSRFNTQQSTPKIDSTFKMPQTPVRCGFKVQNGSTTQLGWIKKKGNKHSVLPFPATLPADVLLFVQQVMSAVPCVTLKRGFFFLSSFFAALLCGHKWRIT